jgi:hypothetical protein
MARCRLTIELNSGGESRAFRYLPPNTPVRARGCLLEEAAGNLGYGFSDDPGKPELNASRVEVHGPYSGGDPFYCFSAI